jgi:hypothetical protein
MGSAQAEQRWRGGATVSSSSPAFGRQWRRRSEAWEWRRKEGMRPLASRGSSSAIARASTRTGRSVWGLPRRRLGGGQAAVARAWRAQGTPGRERSRGGGGRRRRVGMCSSWRWRCGGGEAAARGQCCRRQSRTEQDPRAGERRREGRGPGDWFVISKKCRDLSVN